jgi:hypothetical protein
MFTRKHCRRLAVPLYWQEKAIFFQKEAGKSTQAIEPAQE